MALPSLQCCLKTYTEHRHTTTTSQLSPSYLQLQYVQHGMGVILFFVLCESIHFLRRYFPPKTIFTFFCCCKRNCLLTRIISEILFKFKNFAISNDLERPQTQISRSRHYLTLNISETVRNT